MKYDIESELTIDWSSMHRFHRAEFTRVFSSLSGGKKKWTYSNNDGCKVVYITYRDSYGYDIVSNAYIDSDEVKCNKRIRVHQLM